MRSINNLKIIPFLVFNYVKKLLESIMKHIVNYYKNYGTKNKYPKKFITKRKTLFNQNIISNLLKYLKLLK